MVNNLSPIHPWILVAGILAFAAVPLSAGAQQVTVIGMVVERSESALIGGATVRLSGFPPFFTDRDGAFQFTRVSAGNHTLTVEALGYQPRSMELAIQADTALLIEMDPDPILMDSLLVRAGNITIRGEILDARTGSPVLLAQVTVLPVLSTVGALSGHFTVRGVPRGWAVTVLVEAVGYLPARIALITEADTTLTVGLEPDPVGIRLVAQQVEKLEARAQSIIHQKSIIDRRDLAQYPGWTAYDVLQTRLSTVRHTSNPLGMTEGRMRGQCFFLDDVRVIDTGFFYGLMAGEVERVEIFDRGGMIRVYTKRYVVRLLGRQPPPMVYMKTGLGLVCR